MCAEQPIRVATHNLANESLSRYYVTFPDVQPMIINDRVFVPLRGLEGLWQINSVAWDEATSTAILSMFGNGPSHWTASFMPNGDVIQLHLIEGFFLRMIDPDAPRNLDSVVAPHLQFESGSELPGQQWKETSLVAAQIVDGRMMVPLRMFEALGSLSVSWEQTTRTVLITYYLF